MQKAGSARGKIARKGWLLSLAVLVPALLAITDRGRAASEPLEECVEVKQALERCFGARASAHAPPAPPRGQAARGPASPAPAGRHSRPATPGLCPAWDYP